MRINNGKWDEKWRIVAFDIPEKFKTGRDALRRKLKEVGFHELQKKYLCFSL
jgi:DNA-binding transcriptional regulator PaaX